ncbi:MAG: type II secretion system F family protein [Rhodocyclaceae bacterium]
MPLYAYKAVDADGRTIAGRINAANVADLEVQLRHRELDLINQKPAGKRARRSSGGVGRREVIHFCFHLEQLARAGVPLLEGLSDLRDSIEPLRFREVIASLIESIEGGQTLSQAMEGHGGIFSRVFVSLIRAGEASGQLPEVLHRLSESLKWEDELAAQTKKVLIYPAFVGSVVLAASGFLMIYMVPQLKLFVKNMGQALPLHTQALFFVSDTLLAYWHLVLLLPAMLLAGLQLLLHGSPAARLRLDATRLQVPLLGDILRKIILSRFASTFALLYAAGIPVLDAIRSTQEVVGNRAIRQGLVRVEQLIGEGQNVTTAFHAAGLFPPLVIRMLRIGESTGRLDDALINVSYFYNRDVRESVEKVQQLIEPLLTVLLGGLLGWIMLSVLGPIYDVIGRIGR